MARIWAKIITRGKILRQADMECDPFNQKEVLAEICRGFDLPVPLWLKKQEREMDEFRVTSFTQDNFVEPISFQKLEVEYLEDVDKKRKNADPRNQF